MFSYSDICIANPPLKLLNFRIPSGQTAGRACAGRAPWQPACRADMRTNCGVSHIFGGAGAHVHKDRRLDVAVHGVQYASARTPVGGEYFKHVGSFPVAKIQFAPWIDRSMNFIMRLFHHKVFDFFLLTIGQMVD